MSQISPGAVVICRQTGRVAWVAQRQIAGRWHLRGKRIGNRGRASYMARVAGEGDLQLIEPPRVYEPGTVIQQNGVKYTAIKDNGYTVEFVASDSRFYTKRGTCLYVAGGNRLVVAKADLTLEVLT